MTSYDSLHATTIWKIRVSWPVAFSYKDSYGFVKHGALVCERTSLQKLRESDDVEQ